MSDWASIILALSGLVTTIYNGIGILRRRTALADMTRREGEMKLLEHQMMRDSAEATRKSDSDKRREAAQDHIDRRYKSLIDELKNRVDALECREENLASQLQEAREERSECRETLAAANVRIENHERKISELERLVGMNG